MFNHMAAEDSAEAFRLCTEVSSSILAANIKSLFSAYRQSFFRMIDAERLDLGFRQKLEKYSATATDVQDWCGIPKQLDKRFLNVTNRSFVTAELE